MDEDGYKKAVSPCRRLRTMVIHETLLFHTNSHYFPLNAKRDWNFADTEGPDTFHKTSPD